MDVTANPVRSEELRLPVIPLKSGIYTDTRINI
jgi:hypothetical protein